MAMCAEGELPCCRHTGSYASCSCLTLSDAEVLAENGVFLGCENDPDDIGCMAFDRPEGFTLPPCYFSPMGCWSPPTVLAPIDGQASPLFPIHIRGGLVKEVSPPLALPLPPPRPQRPGFSRCGGQNTSARMANNGALDCGTCDEGGQACDKATIDGKEYCAGMNCRTTCSGGRNILPVPRALFAGFPAGVFAR
jgi:hypothetical protein